MKTRYGLLCIFSFVLSGCSHMPLNHPDPKVAVPAECAGIVGMVAGIPLSIVALPVTMPLAAMNDSPDGGDAYIMAAPSLGLGYLVGNTVGFVPWLIWGWWGNDKYQPSQSLKPPGYDPLPRTPTEPSPPPVSPAPAQ
jgi:hypothetical protein